MANQIDTSSEYYRVSPRATQFGTNRMQASIASTVSASASTEYWMFPLPPKCYVTGGALTGSVPAGTSGNVIIKIGTRETDNQFGTFTVSGTAVLQTRLNIYQPVTVSTSDDVAPYQRAVILTVNSVATSTNSVSLFLLLEYVLPGMLP